MKKIIGFFLLFAFLFCLSSPAVVHCFEETLYMFQTIDDPAVPYDPEVLERAPFWDPEWNAYSPPLFVVPLGASLWAINTRNSDGKVVSSKKRQVGTGTAVAVITDNEFEEFESLAPFYFEASVGDKDFAADGYCIVTNNLLTSKGVVLVGCNLAVLPDFSQGISSGNATSNSIFNLANPEFQTGSFWTLRLFAE